MYFDLAVKNILTTNCTNFHKLICENLCNLWLINKHYNLEDFKSIVFYFNSKLYFFTISKVDLSEEKTEFKPCGSCGGSVVNGSPGFHFPSGVTAFPSPPNPQKLAACKTPLFLWLSKTLLKM